MLINYYTFSLAEFVLGDTGVEECPERYNEITDKETCEQAATALGLTYSDWKNADKMTCHWKSKSNVTGQSVILFGKYGNLAKWVCKSAEPEGK